MAAQAKAKRSKMTPAKSLPAWPDARHTGVIVLADGTVVYGFGAGATGIASGEVCFNTAMTGYQEIMTDPSYAGQIITFTFPHIGNTGANADDDETASSGAFPLARGAIMRASITGPSSYRAEMHLDDWLKQKDIVAVTGIDTRALTTMIREKGMPNAIIAHSRSGKFDLEALRKKASRLPGLEGKDLAGKVSCTDEYSWDQTLWRDEGGYGKQKNPQYSVVAVDYGVKRNILRCLASYGCDVTVVPASTSAADILAMQPDGIFLANGPGDPAATGEYAAPEIRKLIESGKPVFGICLGHQIMALALGAKTVKMHQGHHGANHPVKDLDTGKVEITSMNHGFAVDATTLPGGVRETHVSLFDGSNCGLAIEGKPVFSVQFHPEASPGPQDSHYLFKRFTDNMAASRSRN